MHRCLQIPEIVLQVIELASTISTWPKGTFLSLALVCRAFEDPALDELWRDLGTRGLEYILRCFPADLLKVVVAPHKFVVRLLRPVALADWDRPLRYCNRVRKYDFVDTDTSFVHVEFAKYSNAFTFLSFGVPGECLFPRLESLTWNAEAVNHIRLFLSPHLKKIQLEAYHWWMCRSVAGDDWEEDNVCSVADRKAISAFVRSLNKLTRLVVPALDPEAFYHIATLPGVTSLRLGSLSPDGLPSFPHSTDLFPKLEDLFISLADMPTAIRVLPLVSKSPLSTLSIIPLPSASTAQVSAFYAALTVNIPSSSFCALNQYYAVADGDPVDMWKISREAFLAVSSFSGLTRLAMSCREGYEIDEATLTSLVRGCPNLVSLNLSQSIRETVFTLGTLILIAQHCPYLESLRLTFRTTTIPSLPVDPSSHGGERRTQHPLCALEVGFSTLRDGDAPPIARFLTALFPALPHVWYSQLYGAEGTQILERWDEVNGLILKLRQEELAWAEYDVDNKPEEKVDSAAQEE
ncbi:hypothetical protein C8F01DRAFT_1380194 [Mycena amicta]|nr:hypothetical protein C8F01DRAFT_1380194 [Mycena amicta]